MSSKSTFLYKKKRFMWSKVTNFRLRREKTTIWTLFYNFLNLKNFTYSPLESIFYILFGEKTIEINNLISWPLPPTPS